VDIYALGIILYELAVGRLPFVAETFMGVLHQHMAKAPQPPRELVPDIAPDFERVILRALEKDPADRFQSMNELAEALEACTGRVVDIPTPASEGPADLHIPPLKPQSNVATGRVPALDEESSLGSPSAAPLAVSPAAAASGGKKSSAPLIMVIVVITLALGAGAFLFMRQRGQKPDPSTGPAGSAQTMTPPPVMAGPDAAAVMAPEMREPPMPVYMTPEQVTLTVITSPEKARVYLDDELFGVTPIRRKPVPYGTAERQLTIRKRSYRTVEIKFTPDANQSWERRLRRGRGVTRITTMRVPPGMQGMRPVRPMDGMKTGTEPEMRVAPMPPVMRPMEAPMDFMIIDPFSMM
jgi:serine/threonine-protein kinase